MQHARMVRFAKAYLQRVYVSLDEHCTEIAGQKRPLNIPGLYFDIWQRLRFHARLFRVSNPASSSNDEIGKHY
jgi:hypothetical protein